MPLFEEDGVTPQSVEEFPVTEDSRIVSSSDSDITQTPEKSDIQVSVTGSSSEEYHFGALGFPLELFSDSDGASSPEESQRILQTQKIALEWTQLNKIFAMSVTEEERSQGFRWLQAPNPRYLGFVPGKHDKRKYLNVLPLADVKPSSNFDFVLPVSARQKCGLFIFMTVFIAAGVGVVFYLRSINASA